MYQNSNPMASVDTSNKFNDIEISKKQGQLIKQTNETSCSGKQIKYMKLQAKCKYIKQMKLKKKGESLQSLSKLFLIDPIPSMIEKIPTLEISSSVVIIQNIPIEKQSQLNNQFFESQICALANEGAGVMIIVEKYQGQIIRKGMQNLTSDKIAIVQFMLNRAKNLIINSENIISKIQTVPFLSKFEYLMGEQSKSYCIRIIITQRKNWNKKFFYLSYQNNQKTILEFPIFLKTQNKKKFQIQKIEEKEIYKMFFRRTKYKSETDQVNASFLKAQTLSQNHSNEENGLFERCKNAFEENSFEIYFPKKICSLLKFSENVLQLSQQIQEIFSDSKTDYEFIFPLPKFQKQVLVSQNKSSENDLTLYFTFFYPFNGKYKDFEKAFKKIQNNGKIKNSVIVAQVTKKIKTEVPISVNQVEQIKLLVNKKFSSNMNLIIKHSETTDLVNIEIVFHQEAINIALYCFTFLSLCNLSPKFILYK